MSFPTKEVWLDDSKKITYYPTYHLVCITENTNTVCFDEKDLANFIQFLETEIGDIDSIKAAIEGPQT